MLLSAIFSASEAALFSLSTQQRKKLQDNLTDNMIKGLLANASHLLSCILLCNLGVNLTYYACANVISGWLASDSDGASGNGTTAVTFAVLSVALLILFGELLPKSIGVMAPLRTGRLIVFPLTIAMRITGRLAKGMHYVNDYSRRLIWPGMTPESGLDTSDLERAIELSETDSNLIDLEKGTLQNILQLSAIQAHEWMRPRSQFSTLEMPLNEEAIDRIVQNRGLRNVPEAVFQTVLVTGNSDGEIIAATSINHLKRSLIKGGSPALVPMQYFPWCATLASVFQKMLKTDSQVAAIVSERGDSIGVIFMDDLIEAIFALDSSRTRGFSRPHFAKTGETQWEVTGITRIKQLERAIGIRLPECREATIAGLLQSQLRRLAQIGDQVTVGPITLEVIDLPRRGEMLVRISSEDVEITNNMGNIGRNDR